MNHNTTAVDRDKVVELRTASGIRVTYSSPERVSEVIRRQKINKMYDILLSAERRTEGWQTNESIVHIAENS